jgi:hypothetical protein
MEIRFLKQIDDTDLTLLPQKWQQTFRFFFDPRALRVA